MLYAKGEFPPDPLTDKVIAAAIEVHRHLGPGLLEAPYEECLCLELTSAGLSYVRQMPLKLQYKGICVEQTYVLDLVVEQQLVVELKAIEKILPVHEAQLLTYLKLSGIRKGLLLNFNVPLMREGIRRRVL